MRKDWMDGIKTERHENGFQDLQRINVKIIRGITVLAIKGFHIGGARGYSGRTRERQNCKTSGAVSCMDCSTIQGTTERMTGW